MFKQKLGNVAYLEFNVNIKLPEVILPTIPEPIVEEIIEEEEPEPEPAAPFIFVPPPIKVPKTLESKPLSQDELDEAMSAAPKKDSSGAVVIGPWRPEWQGKASSEEANEIFSRLSV